MHWLTLALIAPFIYALVNLIDDNLLRTVYKSSYVATIISGLFGGVPLLALMFKSLGPFSDKFAAIAVLVGFLTVVFYYNYFRSLEKEHPSVVVSLIGTSPVLIAALAYVFLGERLSGLQFAGLLLVLIGSLGLSYNRHEKLKLTPSIKHVIYAAVVVSVYSILAKYIYQNVDFYTGYMFLSLGMLIGGLVFLIRLRMVESEASIHKLRKTVKKYWALFLVTELLGLLAEFIMNLAISRGPLTPVRVIENIQPVYVILIAAVLFPFRPNLSREISEGGLARKLLLICVCAIGLGLVGLD